MNWFFTRVRRAFPTLWFALLATAFLPACQSGEDEFIGDRVAEECNESWPVCDLVAGCIIGNESYLTGRFPGTKRVIVRLAEAAHITMSFYLKDIASGGSTTTLLFYEGGCKDRTQLVLNGNAFVQEDQDIGYVSRTEDLTDVGDHRLEFTSDAQAEYVFKLDVEPLRLSGTQSP